jgi:DNA-binding NarL/FixJ family response regulator
MAPQNPTRISIDVISDDRLFSDALVQFLIAQPGVAARARPADAVKQQAVDGCDIVLLDARSDAAVSLPSTPVILVGASEDDRWAIAALSAGARGILTRAASRSDLLQAIRVVHEGGIWARRRWLNECILLVVGASRRRTATWDAVDSRLSRREREVLRHAATGVCNKDLADRLSISEATVKVHLTRIFQKLGVPGRAALAAAYHDVTALDPMPLPAGRTRAISRTTS